MIGVTSVVVSHLVCCLRQNQDSTVTYLLLVEVKHYFYMVQVGNIKAETMNSHPKNCTDTV